MVVFLSDIPFDYLRQRPQEIASRFDCGVVYVYTGKWRTEETRGRIRIIQVPSWQFNSKYPIIRRMSLSLCNKLDWLMRLLQRVDARPSVVICESVQLAPLAFSFGCPVVYDCIDRWDGFCEMPDMMRERYLKLRDESNAFLITHEFLRDGVKDAVLVPNGCDVKKFAKKKIVAGYWGVIGDYVDWDWVEDLIKRGWYVVMVGKVKTEVPKIKGLFILPEVRHDLLPVLARCFDVGIIPWKKTYLTEAVDPVKVYEYRAAGLPVLSTLSVQSEMRDWEEVVSEIESIIKQVKMQNV